MVLFRTATRFEYMNTRCGVFNYTFNTISTFNTKGRLHVGVGRKSRGRCVWLWATCGSVGKSERAAVQAGICVDFCCCGRVFSVGVQRDDVAAGFCHASDDGLKLFGRFFCVACVQNQHGKKSVWRVAPVELDLGFSGAVEVVLYLYDYRAERSIDEEISSPSGFQSVLGLDLGRLEITLQPRFCVFLNVVLGDVRHKRTTRLKPQKSFSWGWNLCGGGCVAGAVARCDRSRSFRRSNYSVPEWLVNGLIPPPIRSYSPWCGTWIEWRFCGVARLTVADSEQAMSNSMDADTGDGERIARGVTAIYNADGMTCVPAEIREAIGCGDGDELVWEVQEGEDQATIRVLS